MPFDVMINHGGYTDTLYDTCDSTGCVHAVLYAVGVSRGTLENLNHPLDIDGHPLDVNVSVSVERSGEQDSCTWCAACGDFLSHGLSCDCAERGHDPERDREPLDRPHVDFERAPRFKAWWTQDENALREQDDATRGVAERYDYS